MSLSRTQITVALSNAGVDSSERSVVLARAIVLAGSTLDEKWMAGKPFDVLCAQYAGKVEESHLVEAATKPVAASAAKASEKGAARWESARAYKAPKAAKPAAKPVQKISSIRAGGRCRAAGCNAFTSRPSGFCFECEQDA